MIRRLSLAAVLLVAGPIWAAEQIFDFERDTPGQSPAGFSSAGDVWPVARVERAASGANVLLAPRSVLSAGSPLPLILKESSLALGDIGVQFRQLKEDRASAVGLIWNWQNEENFDQLLLDVTGSVLTVIRVRDGKAKAVKSESTVFTPHMWHSLQVQVLPKQVTVFLDGTPALLAKMKADATPRSVGLSALPGSAVQLDDFAWRAKPSKRP